MTIGEAICEEFCEKVFVSTHSKDSDSHLLDLCPHLNNIEELKCRLDAEYFTELFQRMVQVGYCCTQVQKDIKSNTCTAWFERGIK